MNGGKQSKTKLARIRGLIHQRNKTKASIPLRHVQAPKKVLQSNRQKFQSHYLLTRDTRLLLLFRRNRMQNTHWTLNQTSQNRLVVGSNPTVPTDLLKDSEMCTG